MAAVSSIVIGYGETPAPDITSVPVVTFTVAQVSPALVNYEERSSGVYMLYARQSLGWRLPTAKSKLHRVSFKYSTPLNRPVVDANANTTNIVAGSIQASLEFIIPTLATQGERIVFYRQLVQSLLHAEHQESIYFLDFPY